MKKYYKYKETRNLVPGELHNFLVLKKVSLPDNIEYFVLVDKFGEKHLVPTEYYLKYPININSEYLCHIDKINCMGRIFIEPVHPFYKIGKVYQFKYENRISFVSKKRAETEYYQMIGETGEKAYLPIKYGISENIELYFACIIKKIKKAKIFLELCV